MRLPLRFNPFFSIFSIWLILALALLWTCGIPKEIDFERYMSISQYIFTHNEYLLLHFDGHVYTDKPPLMFWLIVAGWKIFGVHVWWPYLMLSFFSGGSVFMTYQIAKILFEKDQNSAEKAFKSALFLLTLTFFGMTVCELRVDTLLLFFVLLIHYGCLKQNRLGCLALFSGIALGLYSKGPLIFVVGLLPALLGLWFFKGRVFFKSHLKPILISTFFGIIPILFWLIPACIQGGEAYQQDVLFGQIANRSTRGGTSVFFYLLRLPGYLFPFILFPSVWVGIYHKIRYFKKASSTARYCLSGIFLLILVFSLFGQKAMHYLLPTMPLWAIFLVDIVKFEAIEARILKISLWIFAFFGGFICFFHTGIGLSALGYLKVLTDNYTFYLITQSFQWWQAILFLIFSVVSLILLSKDSFKNEKTLLSMIVLLSIVLQINIQILNESYFHARFYTYFHERIVKTQQKNKKVAILFSEKDNQIYCQPKYYPSLLSDIALLNKKTDQQVDYLLSNQRCLFFKSRLFNANPKAVVVPRIFCAFGLWEMNENTKKLVESCSET